MEESKSYISENITILRDDRVFKRVFKRRVGRLIFLINSIGNYNFDAKDVKELREMVKKDNEFDDIYEEVYEITQDEIFGLQKIIEDINKRDEYCAQERLKEESKKQGLEQGLKQGVLQTKLVNAKNLFDLLPDEVISEKLDIDLSVVKNLRQEKYKN